MKLLASTLLILYNSSFVCTFFNFQKNCCSKYHQYPFKELSKNCRVNPNVMVTTPTLIDNYGFKTEFYTATTDDGYILTIFRMVPKINDGFERTPVVLAHGLGVDSGSWLIPDNNRSIAFSLAEEGYDVWLLNFRGTRYSRGHLNMTSAYLEYWNYTLDTMALKDLPTSIEKVAKITKKQILLVSHSRATTLVFMWVSENPKLAQKLLAGVVTSIPVVYFDPRPHIKIIMDPGPNLFKFLININQVVLFYDYELILKMTHYLCARFPYFCNFMLSYFMGFWLHIRPDDLLLTWSQVPLTVETTTLLQYCQNFAVDKFQKFDYGKEGNLREYGQTKPPEYSLERMKIPIYLMSCRRDSITNDKVVRRVYDELGSRVKFWDVLPERDFSEENQFNHADILWGRNVKEVVVPKLLAMLEYFKKYVKEL